MRDTRDLDGVHWLDAQDKVSDTGGIDVRQVFPSVCFPSQIASCVYDFHVCCFRTDVLQVDNQKIA